MTDLILKKLEAIERNSLLAAKNVLTLDDVVYLTGISKSYLYKLTCAKEIPFYRPSGKQMYFDRAEIENWMKRNRVYTKEECAQEALSRLSSN